MKKTLAVLALLFLPALASAQELTQDQVENLKPLQAGVKTIARLKAEGVLNQEQADHYKQEQLQLASVVVGKPVTTTDNLDELIHKNDTSRFWGFFTFIGVLKVFGGILLALALIALAVIYIGPMLAHMPVGFWEFAAYVFVVVGLLSGHLWPFFGIWLVFPACLLLIAALTLTKSLHFDKKSDDSYKDAAGLKSGRSWLSFSFAEFTALVCTIVWSAAAIYYQSYLLGFMSVMMLLAFLGFSVIVMPGCVGMGFDKDDNIPKATVASLAILLCYALTEITGGFNPTIVDGVEVYSPLIYFRTGAIFMGTFVYFLGLLISSSWYYNRKRGNYILMQIITIVSGVAAFYFGATFGLNSLLGIGGTFFVIYLLEKYSELPWKEIGWAWGLLGMAGLLFGAAHLAGKYPEYFLLGLK